VERIFFVFSIAILFLVICGCSAKPPAAGAQGAAIVEKINTSRDYYDGLVLTDPDNSAAWLIRGMYYNNAFGRYEEALRSYNRSLELDPESGLAWYAKGITLRNMHRFSESETCFEQAEKYRMNDQTFFSGKPRPGSGY